MFNTLGESLYHYTTAHRATKFILPAMRLRLNPFSTMRDPRESHDWMSGVTQDAEPQSDDLWTLQTAVNEAKVKFKVLSLTEDSCQGGDPSLDPLAERFQFGYSHPRLWEQYAQNHEGVCLCLNREALLRNAERELGAKGTLIHGPVTYRDGGIVPEAVHHRLSEIRAIGIEQYVEQHLQRHRDELFFHKLLDWATEVEYRVLLQVDHPDAEYVDISGSLEAVICGSSISKYYRTRLRNLSKPMGVELAVMAWRNGLPILLPAVSEKPVISLDGIVIPARQGSR